MSGTLSGVPFTWTWRSAAGTWWWGCRVCAKRRPVLRDQYAAQRAAALHEEGPVHRRSARRLAALRLD